ncbi:glycosyltransferase family 39 protein [Frankia sp. R82]|uniref:glycosyltransferase family 39 protein n=1 Tax=Frankia sp. R82 TaxID=2950553 RepID=UPI0020449469|nr:glycosyltransferase family 39 protein [Frankia sp. R82]MCM3882981.1 glycosyltransferase family 39 protein [Frankia sp. R82]
MTDVAVRPAEHKPEPVDQVGNASGRAGRAFTIVVGALVAAAVIVRFTATQALWLDEAQSVAIARLPLSGAGTTLWDGLLQDGSPPLYYLLLHGWISVFGESTLAVRSLSAVINILAAWPLYVVAQRVIGERGARVSVVLYLTSPFALYFGTETRMYSLIVLLTALGGVALERVLRAPSAKSVIGLAVAAGCLALTHYWCLYLLVTVGVWLLGLLFLRPWYRARRARRGGTTGQAPGTGDGTDGVDGLGGAGIRVYPATGGGTGLGSPTAAGTGLGSSAGVGPVGRPAGGARSHRSGGRGASSGTASAGVASARRGPIYALIGLVGGGLVFAPWLPSFFDQLAHTGTPWGEPASYAAISHAYGQWAGGPTTLGRLLLFLVTGLAAAGLAGQSTGGRFLLIDLRGREPGRTLFFLATGTLFVAVTAGKLVGNAWADRYTATAFVPFLLVLGLGSTVIGDRRIFQGVIAVAAAIGLLAGTSDVHRERSQATEAAHVLQRLARPGDVMLVCPDQIGPGLSRTVPSWLKVYVVPTYAPPDRVDWVDYEQRNENADGREIARRALAEAGPGHTVFLAGSGAYRTYEDLCTEVQTTLAQARPHADQVMKQGLPAKVYENYALLRFQAS